LENLSGIPESVQSGYMSINSTRINHQLTLEINAQKKCAKLFWTKLRDKTFTKKILKISESENRIKLLVR